jgi:hypothetical protein
MRRALVGGLAGLFLLSVVAMAGCGSGEKAKVPEKTIELPKQGPVEAGAAGGNKKRESSQ